MIPIYQSRHSLEEVGDCFEACVASILELPLRAVPSRADFVDRDDWRRVVADADGDADRVAKMMHADVFGGWEGVFRGWLGGRGLGWLDLRLGWRARGFSEKTWLELAETNLIGGYWIGVHELVETKGLTHAIVYRRAEVVHNPHRGLIEAELLGDLIAAHVLTAGDPPKIARRLGPELLPSVPPPPDPRLTEWAAIG